MLYKIVLPPIPVMSIYRKLSNNICLYNLQLPAIFAWSLHCRICSQGIPFELYLEWICILHCAKLDMADLVDIDLSLMKTFPTYVDFATMPVKTQSICGPPVGSLMGSGILFANYAKMIKAAFRLINPLRGQSRSWFCSFGIIKWTNCWLAQGHNKNHCN